MRIPVERTVITSFSQGLVNKHGRSSTVHSREEKQWGPVDSGFMYLRHLIYAHIHLNLTLLDGSSTEDELESSKHEQGEELLEPMDPESLGA